jgi:hypothetical protein
MPNNYNEQMKIPTNHYYENNILKYGEPWTGDVWKIMYYMLINFKDKFTITYFTNINYRGSSYVKNDRLFSNRRQRIGCNK